MKILDLIETDFVNYKKTCMTVMFPYCSFKCNKEANKIVCHNYQFNGVTPFDIEIEEIISKYLTNPMSEAIVMQGLEPFDSFEDLCSLVTRFSEESNDDIVIYTGYTEDEIVAEVQALSNLVKGNTLIIKFGRFIPDSQSRIEPILGVTLQSDNQYAKIIKEGE